MLTGCFASVTPSVRYSQRPAYVYYDSFYGTYVYLPYKIRHASPRYVYRKHIRNYRGQYKNYKRHIRFYKPKVRTKSKNHTKKKNKGKSKFKKR